MRTPSIANFMRSTKMLHDAFGTKEWNGNLHDVMKELLAIRSRVSVPAKQKANVKTIWPRRLTVASKACAPFGP
jgi:hypothetical protein